MVALILAALVSLIAAAMITPVCRRFCLRMGLVDIPDARRKLHGRITPRGGGIAIAFAISVGYATLWLTRSHGNPSVGQSQIAEPLIGATVIVFLTGLIDDIKTLNPLQKVTGQLLAAVCACAGGVRIGSLAGIPVSEPVGYCVTVLWLLVCCNALNLIDGLDGLAAGVGLFATVTAFITAILQGNMELALVTAPLAGALVGFLRYNFNPASIFLGDCGSLLIGFLLGCFGVIWSQKSATLLGITAPLMALCVPILDTSLSMARRFIRRKPVFSADRGHIHHRLLDLGLHPRRAVLVLYSCSGIAATLSLLSSVPDNRLSSIVIVIFCACVCFGVHKLGYAEFNVLGKVLTRGTIRREVDATISLINLQEALTAADDPRACWTAVRETCRQFGYNDVRLSLAGVEYADRTSTKISNGWTVRIPLSEEDDYIQLNREFRRTEPEVLASLADTLRTSLEPKIAAIRPTDRRDANW